uniref:Uncharacterized protein LOC105122546 isoform X1 n=2 Tax=Rhizophora mucronata TaxID=61149 RepID=A0A2P2JMA1_RHIMU
MAEPTEMAPSSSREPSTSQKSKDDALKPPFQVPAFSYCPAHANGDFQMFPIMYPTLVPSLQNQEQMNRGAGLYAVPCPSYMGPIAGLPQNTLIPLTFNIPTANPEAGAAGDHGQGGQQQQRQQPAPPEPQRQVAVRRFQIAFQLDLFLILKLAAVIFLFNQDGSRQRLAVLVFFASLIYLYQTGALTPLVRWLSQSMHRAAAPPHPPRPAVRAENGPAAARQNQNVVLAEGQAGAENGNRPAEDGNPAIENGNVGVEEHGGGDGGNYWWGIVREIQMIVFGFITSLLPGFHNID